MLATSGNYTLLLLLTRFACPCLVIQGLLLIGVDWRICLWIGVWGLIVVGLLQLQVWLLKLCIFWKQEIHLCGIFLKKFVTSYEPKSCEFFCLFNFYLLKDSTHPLLLLSPWSFFHEYWANCWVLECPCWGAGLAECPLWRCWVCLVVLLAVLGCLGVSEFGDWFCWSALEGGAGCFLLDSCGSSFLLELEVPEKRAAVVLL